LRIIVLAHRIPYPPNKGEKIRTYHQIEYLKRQGHEIVVCSLLEKPGDLDDAKALADHLSIEVQAVPMRFRHARRVGALLSGKTLSVSNFESPALQLVFDQQLKSGHNEAILCTSSTMADYVFRGESLLQSESSSPVLIMDFMDLDSDKWRQYAERSSFPMSLVYARESRLLEAYELRVRKRFAHCLFVSQNEVDLFEQRTGKVPANLKVVGNGVDSSHFHPADTRPETLEPRLIFTGVMDYLPNEDAVVWFVESLWSRIRARWPNATFTIAGMAPSAKVRALSQFEGIHITGKVESMLPYFQESNVFVAPFRLARGLQNKVLQAFAAGVPVVSSPSGAEGIDCEDQEHLLIANTPDEYLDAIARLLEENELYDSVRSNALSLILNHYCWDGQNRGLLECLESHELNDNKT